MHTTQYFAENFNIDAEAEKFIQMQDRESADAKSFLNTTNIDFKDKDWWVKTKEFTPNQRIALCLRAEEERNKVSQSRSLKALGGVEDAQLGGSQNKTDALESESGEELFWVDLDLRKSYEKSFLRMFIEFPLTLLVSFPRFAEITSENNSKIIESARSSSDKCIEDVECCQFLNDVMLKCIEWRLKVASLLAFYIPKEAYFRKHIPWFDNYLSAGQVRGKNYKQISPEGIEILSWHRHFSDIFERRKDPKVPWNTRDETESVKESAESLPNRVMINGELVNVHELNIKGLYVPEGTEYRVGRPQPFVRKEGNEIVKGWFTFSQREGYFFDGCDMPCTGIERFMKIPVKLHRPRVFQETFMDRMERHFL